MPRPFVPTPLKLCRPVPSDIEIAQGASLKLILQVAEETGIRSDELELYGPYKAKVKLEILERLKDQPDGKYIDVTAITPTPPGGGQDHHDRRPEPGAEAGADGCRPDGEWGDSAGVSGRGEVVVASGSVKDGFFQFGMSALGLFL